MSLLQPTDRSTLLDSLRPPAGFSFDAAVATTYSLHLDALLTAPLAFALYDAWEEGDIGHGSEHFEPIAVLDAVRRYAQRMVVFAQAGQIAVPPSRAVFAWLEDVVTEVTAGDTTGVFHPKVWLIRFRRFDDDAAALRLLCLSRNLTFDRSWDTILRLDSHIVGADVSAAIDPSPLQRFIRALPQRTVTPLHADRATLVTDLADDLDDCAFALPEGMRDGAFWPLGITDSDVDPLPPDFRRSLTISPFVTPKRLAAITRQGADHILISRAEELNRLPTGALDGFSDVFTLSPDTDLAVMAEEDDDETTTSAADVDSDVLGEHDDDPASSLSGLHAKVVVAEDARGATVLTGSANATTAAFGRNVEFVTELYVPGLTVDALLEDTPGQTSLMKLLDPYTPPDAPIDRAPEEQLADALDLVRRQIASRTFSARVSEGDETPYRLTVAGELADITLPEGIEVTTRCWPVTLNDTYARPMPLTGSVELVYGCSLEALTAFFAIELHGTQDDVEHATRFVVTAPLSGVPDDRHTRIIAAILRDRGRFIRYLLLLLGDPTADDQMAGDGAGWFGRDGLGVEGQQDLPLFEVLVRALARTPDRLDHVASLVAELRGSDAGTAILPEGFQQLWEPLWAAKGAADNA